MKADGSNLILVNDMVDCSAMPGITSVDNSSSSDGLQEIILELSLLKSVKTHYLLRFYCAVLSQ